MNREIKFRAWDGSKKVMLYSDSKSRDGSGISFHFFNHGIKWGVYDNSLGNRIISGEYKENVLMQYTGLRDIKEKEIYEADIISRDKRLYEVAINFNGFYLQAYRLWRGKFKPSFQYSLSLITKPFKKGERGENGGIVEFAEVIGNIYQNPELVESLKIFN